MGERLLGGLGRAVGWNVLLGSMSGFATGLVLAIALSRDPSAGGAAPIVPVFGLAIGLGYGVAAGLVHGVLQLPLLAWPPPHPRAVLRIFAMLVSIGLVLLLVLIGTDEWHWQALALFAPYVLLTPVCAAWGYRADG